MKVNARLSLFLLGCIVLAGCISQQTFAGGSQEVDLSSDVVNQNGWVKAGESSQIIQVSSAGVSTNMSLATAEYTEPAFNERVNEQLLGIIDQNVSWMFVTQVNESNIPAMFRVVLLGEEDLLDRAATRIKERGSERGVTFEQVDETSLQIGEHTVEKAVFSGSMTYGGRTFQAAGGSFTVEEGTMPVRADVYTLSCPAKDSKYVFLGMYPDGILQDRLQENITQAIQIDIKVQLNFRTNMRRNAVKEVIKELKC